MDILNTVIGLWPIFASLLGIFIWLVRLGDRMNTAEKNIKEAREDIAIIHKDYQALTSDLLKELSKVKESLARLEGALHIRKRSEA